MNAVRASASSVGIWEREDTHENPSNEHEDPDEDDFRCAPCETGGITELRRHPGNPAQEEVGEQKLTHCPFRSWCPICVEAQGRHDPQYKGTREERGNESAAVSMDYKEISEYDESKMKTTMIACRNKWTKCIAAHAAKAKGSTEDAARIVEFLD